MIKVDLVFSKSVYGQAGDRTFVRCMGEHKELFAQNGVDLRIITPDLYSSQSLNFIRPVKATWKHSVAMFITKYSALATRLFIYLRIISVPKALRSTIAKCQTRVMLLPFKI